MLLQQLTDLVERYDLDETALALLTQWASTVTVTHSPSIMREALEYLTGLQRSQQITVHEDDLPELAMHLVNSIVGRRVTGVKAEKNGSFTVQLTLDL